MTKPLSFFISLRSVANIVKRFGADRMSAGLFLAGLSPSATGFSSPE
jgi:hypothetical protein